MALFLALDLDMLVAGRTAPHQSHSNPSERVMSVINLALQNVALDRDNTNAELEQKLKSRSTMKAVRQLAEKEPRVKTQLMKSIEPVILFSL